MQKNSQQLHQKKTKPPRIMQVIAITGVAFAFTVAALAYPTHQTKAQEQTTTTTATSSESISTTQSSKEETQRELEQRLEEINTEIKQQENIISDIRSDERTIENKLNQLKARISSLNLQIEAVEINLQKINQDIYETQRSINRTQNKIEEHKDALGDSLQKVYETDKQSLIAILLKNDQVSDFFNSVNNILLVQNNIRTSLDEVVNLRQELIQEKEELAQEKKEAQNLKNIRQNQKYQISSAKNEQERLLSLTIQERKQEEKELQEKRKTANEIRNQIFKLVGAEDLTFEEAFNIAKIAGNSTGIRPALIMAILQRETNTGNDEGEQFLGGCSYEDAMHPDRDIPIFLEITDTLNLDPNSSVTKVSCPIKQHGYYGGAMGPSQFIASTWACYGGLVNSKTGSCRWGKNYTGSWDYRASKDRIKEVTGDSSPSNPWNNVDAFTATALYIKDLYSSNTCTSYADGLDHKYPRQELQEECASARYYAGSNWRDYYSWYGIDVVQKANEIQQDIDVISS